ncbi:MAG: hypothetical protein KC431_25460, partial [Myxococcales bacterium]|nr:hypothetical protein [Myxococcales bacterium]
MSEEDGAAEPEPYTLEHMLTHRRAFLQAICLGFPLSHETLERHGDVLDWQILSNNAHLDWSLALLERHAWHWWDSALFMGLRSLSYELRSTAPFECYVEFRGSEVPHLEERLRSIRAELAAGKFIEPNSHFTPFRAGADTPTIELARIEGLEPALVEEFLRALEFGDEPRHQDLEERIV